MSLRQRLQRAAPYHAHFLGSFNHAWLALVTLGIGIGIAEPLSILVGVAAYGLGVIFLPDLPVFRKRYDEMCHAEIDAREEIERATKEKTRTNLLGKLSTDAKARREKFSTLCAELENRLGAAGTSDFLGEKSLAKVADSHLLLLAMDADIREYLKSAEAEASLNARAEQLHTELEILHKRTDLADVEQRLVLSKEETVKNIRQQAEQSKRMRLNLELAQSEIQRLESQIAFLKAELIANPAGQLSNRLDETLIQVEASQRVLQEGGVVNAPDVSLLLGESA